MRELLTLFRHQTLSWSKAHPDAAKGNLENCVGGPVRHLIYRTLHVYLYPWNYLKSVMQIISLIHVNLISQSNHLVIPVMEEIKGDKKRDSNFCPSTQSHLPQFTKQFLIYPVLFDLHTLKSVVECRTTSLCFLLSEIYKKILQLFFAWAKMFAETTNWGSFF